jgi:hypothetical protein
MTAAYVKLDANNPSGGQTPAAFATSALANVRALRDAAVCGFSPDFAYSQSGGTAKAPTYRIWSNAATGIRFRAECVYGNGTYPNMPTTIKWWWSDDAGVTWAAMDAVASTITWDTTSGILHITAVDRNAGLWVFALSAMAAAEHGHAALATHAALTGANVHGLGTMSTQSTAAVGITGGSVNASLGATTANPADVTRLREIFTNLGAIANGGTATMTVNTAAHFAMTPSATQADTMTIAVSNPPASGKSQTIMWEIINGRRSADAKITYPASFKWLGGSASRPNDTTLELAGRNLFSATTRDGGATWDVIHLGKRG